MSGSTYPHSKKKKLADVISKIKKKEDLSVIAKIIKKDGVNITSNQNGLFLVFNNLSDEAYVEIENYIKLIKKSSKSETSDTSSDIIKKHIPYYNDDIIENQEIKYTNKERNIIKRQRYEQMMSDNKNDNES